MDWEQLFEKVFINSELAANVCEHFNMSRKDYSELTEKLNLERKDEIQVIQRIRSLYHNKKQLDGFAFSTFNDFYKWHKLQFVNQKGKCYYCKTEEHVIATLFEKKYHNRKRTTRGKHLEIERKDSINNIYSKDNCVLACYFCNNDKSEFFSEQEYFEYLKDRNAFLNTQFTKLNDPR